ncbi:MAG: hypothetical protein WAM42_00070 [Candidatus Nitrosopolaris sp.]
MYLSGDPDILNMARIDLSIDDKLDTQFRDMVYKTMGMKRGNLRIALEEAIKIWLSSKKGSGRVR